MHDRYRAALALTSLLLLAAAPPQHRHHNRARPAHIPSRAPALGLDLYSRRALRRAQIILELKLMELREERLDAIKHAIERRIHGNELLAPVPTPTPSP